VLLRKQPRSKQISLVCFCLGVFIVSAKRTPFGTYGGVLKDHSATDLAEHAAKAALAAGNVAPELVNSIIMGNVMQVGYDIPLLARVGSKVYWREIHRKGFGAALHDSKGDTTHIDLRYEAMEMFRLCWMGVPGMHLPVLLSV